MVHTTLHECKDKSDQGNAIWKMRENYKECTNDVDMQNIAQRCLIFDGMAIDHKKRKVGLKHAMIWPNCLSRR